MGIQQTISNFFNGGEPVNPMETWHTKYASNKEQSAPQPKNLTTDELIAAANKGHDPVIQRMPTLRERVSNPFKASDKINDDANEDTGERFSFKPTFSGLYRHVLKPITYAVAFTIGTVATYTARGFMNLSDSSKAAVFTLTIAFSTLYLGMNADLNEDHSDEENAEPRITLISPAPNTTLTDSTPSPLKTETNSPSRITQITPDIVAQFGSFSSLKNAHTLATGLEQLDAPLTVALNTATNQFKVVSSTGKNCAQILPALPAGTPCFNTQNNQLTYRN